MLCPPLQQPLIFFARKVGTTRGPRLALQVFSIPSINLLRVARYMSEKLNTENASPRHYSCCFQNGVSRLRMGCAIFHCSLESPSSFACRRRPVTIQPSLPSGPIVPTLGSGHTRLECYFLKRSQSFYNPLCALQMLLPLPCLLP